ncbi:hypothetical protein BC829DRAFT_156023 [Chytridium lagenaria]|nr:hypothetical protein BC829DRAFT_156023 [Chytridium lagenaria]
MPAPPTDSFMDDINSILNSAPSSFAPPTAAPKASGNTSTNQQQYNFEAPQTPSSMSFRSTPSLSTAETVSSGHGTNTGNSSASGGGDSSLDNAPVKDFPEIAYVTDEAGNILSLQEDEWNMFIAKNADLPIPPHIERCMSPNIIGRNLFEFISDEKVQAFSRHIVYMLCSGQQQKYQYYWFCDSPDIERKMFMTVSALTGFGSAKLVLWVSKVMSEKLLRLPQNYLNSPALTASETSSDDSGCGVPTNTVCSFWCVLPH